MPQYTTPNGRPLAEHLAPEDLLTAFMLYSAGDVTSLEALQNHHAHLDFEAPRPTLATLAERVARIEAAGLVTCAGERVTMCSDLRRDLRASESLRVLGWRVWWRIHGEMGRPFRQWEHFRRQLAERFDEPALIHGAGWARRS